MKSFKKILSFSLGVAMLFGTITPMAVNAADTKTIYEDFGEDVVIDKDNKTVTTSSGISITATDEFYSKMKVDENGFFIPQGANDAVFEEIDFKFEPITSGTAEISFDITVTNAGHSHPGELGALYGEDAEGASLKVVNNFLQSCKTYAGVNYTPEVRWGNGSAKDKVVMQLNERKRLTYSIDMMEKTYEVSLDGVSLEKGSIAETVSAVNCIKFKDDWNHGTEYIDNITVAYDTEANTKTIAMDKADDIQAVYGRRITLPTADKSNGQIFKGWKNADGKLVPNTFIVTEDLNLTADYRSLVNIKEDFGDGFSIDYAAKTISSASGLTFATSKDTTFDTANGIKVASNGLKVDLNGGNLKSSDVYLKFPNITTGKVYMSFDLYNNHTSSGHTQNRKFFMIGDEENNDWAASLTTVGTNQFKTDDGEVLNEGTIEYVIDLDNNTYTITSGGVQVGATHELKETTGFNSIYLTTTDGGWYSVAFSIDNLEIVEDMDSQSYTITYVSDGQTFETKSALNGKVTSFPTTAPTKAGYMFEGWFTAEGTEITAANISTLTENTTLTARFRAASVLKEDFGTGFTLDLFEKTVSTTSGFGVEATEGFYNYASIQDGALRLEGYDKGAFAGDKEFYLTFPQVKSGKAYVSFDMALEYAGYANWFAVYGKPYFGIGNKANGQNAASVYVRGMNGTSTMDGIVYLASKNGSNGSSADTFGTITKDAGFSTVEFVIDMDNKTYSVTYGGNTYENIAFTGVDGVDCISVKFSDDNVRNKNCDILIDNVVLVENPDANKYTVTFMNGEDTFATASAVYGRPISLPTTVPSADDKVFMGWFTSDNKQITAANAITFQTDTVVYARFRDIHNITEDFANATVSGTTLTSTSGLTYELSAVKGDNYNGTTPIFEIKDGSLFVNERQNGVSNAEAKVNFAKVYDNKLYLAFDYKTPSWEFSNFYPNGRDIIHITDGNGTIVARLSLDGFEASTNAGYYVKTVTSGTHAEDANTVTSFELNGAGYSEYVKFVYVFDLENGTYTISANGSEAKTFNFEKEVDGIAQLAFVNGGSGTYHYFANHQIDNIKVIENFDGNLPVDPVEPTEYTVIFYDEDGVTVLDTVKVKYGETAVYTGKTPSKTANAQYTYTFEKWDKALTNITADTSVKAVYTKTVNKYKVTFVGKDGVILKEEMVEYNSDATAPEAPAVEGFTFKGWEGVFTSIKGAVTITAIYEKNAAVSTAKSITTIEPMSNEEYKKYAGSDIEEGTYAWKLRFSIDGLKDLEKKKVGLNKISGTLLTQASTYLYFADDYEAYVDSMLLEDQSEITNLTGAYWSLMNGFGPMDEVAKTLVVTFLADDASTAYPSEFGATVKNSKIDDMFVVLLLTNTDTFSMQVTTDVDIDEIIENAYDGERYAYRTYARESANEIQLNLNAKNITVNNGTIVSGGVEADTPSTEILSYADGKIKVNSSENGILYIVKKTAGVVTAQRTEAITANTEVSFDFAEGETAYLWNSALAPICNPFAISK